MFACVGTPISVQISDLMYQYLETDSDDIPLKIMQGAVIKLIETSGGFRTLTTSKMTSLAHTAGTIAGHAAAKATVRTLIVETAESLPEAGY